MYFREKAKVEEKLLFLACEKTLKISVKIKTDMHTVYWVYIQLTLLSD